MNKEALGPAERIIRTMLQYVDHCYHGRPGLVEPDATSHIGVTWSPAVWKQEPNGGPRIVSKPVKQGKKTVLQPVGQLEANLDVTDGRGKRVGRFQPPGLFPEAAAWAYAQVAEVWRLDNEFAARWASYAFAKDHRDLKVILAAFMLVQSRVGAPILDEGKLSFYDRDFREVGEAMMLTYRKAATDLGPKELVRIRDVLRLPAVAELNRKLGFGRSGRRPTMGRWTKTAERWLRYREQNPELLAGLMRAGYRQRVMQLAKAVGYKPESPTFFQTLRWAQSQAKDGHRTMALGETLVAAESWAQLSEAEICERIVASRPSYKRIISLVPRAMGVTRAMLAAAVEANVLSDKDLVILSPTLEAHGLLTDADVRRRWERALKSADDMRAVNIAKNVQTAAVKAKLETAADKALQAAVQAAAAESGRDFTVYFFVDVSSSMEGAIEKAKDHLTKLVHAFPLDRVHVFVFNTVAREVVIPARSAKGVEMAFEGIKAGGGTDYGSAVKRAGELRRPKPDTDVLFFFVGDEQNSFAATFEQQVIRSKLEPLAFGFVRCLSSDGVMTQRAVQDTAAKLSVPCMLIDERTFADMQAIPRTLRTLVASTPAGKIDESPPEQVVRTLVDHILATDLLRKPTWASLLTSSDTPAVNTPAVNTPAVKSGAGAGAGAGAVAVA